MMSDRSKKVIELRESGMSLRIIALEVGVTKQAVQQIVKRHRPDLLGPLGESPFKAGSGSHRCVSCGRKSKGVRCMECAKYWTEERAIKAGREYYNKYGRSPSANDFNLSYLRKRGEEEAIKRFESGRYPHLTTVQRLFGGWNNYLRACGLPLNPNGGAGHKTKNPYKEVA